MKLGTSATRASSSSFIKWNNKDADPKNAALRDAATKAADALKAYEIAMAQEAISASVDQINILNSKSVKTLRIHGHLFDKNLINRIMDVVVDAGMYNWI